MHFSFSILVVVSALVLTTSHVIKLKPNLEVRGWPNSTSKDNKDNVQPDSNQQQRKEACERQLAWVENELMSAMTSLFDAIQDGSNLHRLQAARQAVRNLEQEVSQIKNEISRLR